MSSTQRRSNSRMASVDGLLLLNKPSGMTSNRALQTVKRLLRARKAGHTGSLDPAATGMLPLCFGEATKVCAFLLDADKTYRVTAKLGASTDTGDRDGEIVETADVPALSFEEWHTILQGFLGKSSQIPPMYSALKQDGKRLYELARKGQVVERQPRKITVHEIDLMEIAGRRLVFRVECSKGTYIRTLVEDIARLAGTVAHTARLHRESVGQFRQEDMLDLDAVAALAEENLDALRRRLLPPDIALSDFPDEHLTDSAGERFTSGQAVPAADDTRRGLVRVYGPHGSFLGIGECRERGRLVPRRVFLNREKTP